MKSELTRLREQVKEYRAEISRLKAEADMAKYHLRNAEDSVAELLKKMDKPKGKEKPAFHWLTIAIAIVFFGAGSLIQMLTEPEPKIPDIEWHSLQNAAMIGDLKTELKKEHNLRISLETDILNYKNALDYCNRRTR